MSDFYTDRERYAFQTQMFFLLSRYHQQRRSIPQTIAQGTALLSDYTFEKDSIFARINLIGDELDMYYRVHAALAEKIPLPDLVIYLRADIDVLMQRIALRDRPYERNMERTYIENLAQAYDNFYLGDQDASTERTVPVLTIDTNNLDYVRHADILKLVENRLRQALKLEPFQAELPIHNPIE